MRPSYRGRAGAGAGSGKIINLVDDTSGGRISHLLCTCFSPFVCLLQAQSTMVPRPSYFSRLWPSLCDVSTLPFRYPTSAYNVTPTSGENSPPPAVACIRSVRANLTAVCNCCTREFSPTLTHHITKVEKESSSDSVFTFPPDLYFQPLPLLCIPV